ncbi:MAG: YceH family protein [bacterium]
MQTLRPDECRALGTLIEKAMTVPGQYPLSLNSLVTGINQKSNREPVVEIDEDGALRAVDGLRAKGLARDVTFTGSRVEKYRHTAGEALEARAPELAILAELLLRGPQTVGELRGRASRMHPFDSLEAVEAVLAGLAARATPLVREHAPLAGSRANRWSQLLCPDLHRIAEGVPSAPSGQTREETRLSDSAAPSPDALLSTRVASLEARVDMLERMLAELRASLGST